MSVPRLRHAAQARVDASSLSATAREIGLTHRGLSLFLTGAKPHPKTLAKLLRWYRREIEDAEGPPVTPGEALKALLHTLPANNRAAAHDRVAALMRELHAGSGTPAPNYGESPHANPIHPATKPA